MSSAVLDRPSKDYQCKRCGFAWDSHLPVRCPKCSSIYWKDA